MVTESEQCCIRAENHVMDMQFEFPDSLRTVKTLQAKKTLHSNKGGTAKAWSLLIHAEASLSSSPPIHLNRTSFQMKLRR